MNTPLSPNDAIRFNSLEGTLRARLSHQEGTCAKLQALVDLAQAAASLDGVEEDAFNDLDRTKREASLALKAKDETELALAALSVTDGIPGRVRGALLQLGEGSEAECTAYAARWSSFLFLVEAQGGRTPSSSKPESASPTSQVFLRDGLFCPMSGATWEPYARSHFQEPAMFARWEEEVERRRKDHTFVHLPVYAAPILPYALGTAAHDTAWDCINALLGVDLKSRFQGKRLDVVSNGITLSDEWYHLTSSFSASWEPLVRLTCGSKEIAEALTALSLPPLLVNMSIHYFPHPQHISSNLQPFLLFKHLRPYPYRFFSSLARFGSSTQGNNCYNSVCSPRASKYSIPSRSTVSWPLLSPVAPLSIPPPDPEIMELHYLIFRVKSARGGAERIFESALDGDEGDLRLGDTLTSDLALSRLETYLYAWEWRQGNEIVCC